MAGPGDAPTIVGPVPTPDDTAPDDTALATTTPAEAIEPGTAVAQTAPGEAAPAQTPSTRGSRMGRVPWRWIGRTVAVGVALFLVPVAWSYGHALTRPTDESVGIRTTEWMRDHGGRGIVVWAETFWYDHHQPKKGGVPALSALPKVTTPPDTTPPSTVAPVDTPTPVRLLASPALPGEGQWQPTGRTGADGLPLLYTTFIRPDPIHTSLVTGLAWMDPTRVNVDLYSGYDEPGGKGWTLTAPIQDAVRPALVAAFNSGFKLADSRGGYMAEGRVAPGHPLVPGRAALIVRTDGSVTVGMWGRDAVAGPDIRAVRENLQLLIDGGREASDLDVNSLANWGWTVKNATLVWRSGVGVDAKGHLIYAAGNGLSVHSLADVLLAAGCVRAMELDINSEWVSFLSYASDPSVPGGAVGTKLIPDMRTSSSKYFGASDRDFFAVFARADV